MQLEFGSHSVVGGVTLAKQPVAVATLEGGGKALVLVQARTLCARVLLARSEIGLNDGVRHERGRRRDAADTALDGALRAALVGRASGADGMEAGGQQDARAGGDGAQADRAVAEVEQCAGPLALHVDGAGGKGGGAGLCRGFGARTCLGVLLRFLGRSGTGSGAFGS